MAITERGLLGTATTTTTTTTTTTATRQRTLSRLAVSPVWQTARTKTPPPPRFRLCREARHQGIIITHTTHTITASTASTASKASTAATGLQRLPQFRSHSLSWPVARSRSMTFHLLRVGLKLKTWLYLL
jgi:hypothetical protein